MLKGSRDAILKRLQPVSIHGQISYDLHFVYPEEPDQIRVARLGPEAIENGLEPGDRIVLEFLLGVVTRVSRSA